jgi:HlyD family secretion protein
MRPLLLLLVLAAACSSSGTNQLTASGTVEVVETDIAPAQPARIVSVRVDESDSVRAGDTLAVLTQASAAADIAERAARVAAAEAALRDLRAGARATDIRAAQAELTAAHAQASKSAADLARVRPLATSGVTSRQALDAAVAAAQSAAGREAAAAEEVQRLRQGARPEEIRAAEANLAAARAALRAREAVAADLVLTAPGSGVVLLRVAEPGEILQAGEPLLTLGDLSHPWARVYVAPTVARRLRLGGRATGLLDGVHGPGVPGRIAAISDRAEFTPRVALTERERADLLIGVKVAFTDTTRTLHPGLPITVRFEDAAP